FIGATNDNVDQILAADYSKIPGIKLFVGSSTGNMLVNSPEALVKLFAGFSGVIAVHAEDEAVIKANREWLMKEYGEKVPIALHSLLRSREACVKASKLVVDLARKHNSRLHLLHISTADELRLLSPSPIEEKRITAETCPHYLIFTASDLLENRGFTRKCNPAIKGEGDRNALRKAVADGLIDIVATDHAPHLLTEKQGTLFTAASGMPGVKFMLPLMLSIADENGLSLEKIVEKVSHNPAKLYSIDRRGFIRPGFYADLTLVDHLEAPHTITDGDAATAGAPDAGCDWTPYLGLTTRYAVRSTWVNGKLVYDSEHIITSNRNPLPLTFNH
ncbi:MAG: amidohydrolase family protein, partial [Muribaculaceae bacterium]|nr:amidohydrolase family protein [Muribaculaceae bacterium]